MIGVDDRDVAAPLDHVVVDHEAVISRGGRILPQTFARPYDRISFPRFAVRYLLRTPARRPDGLWVADNLTPDSYFHWVTEALARLERCEGIRAPLLLPAYYARQPFVPFSLRAFRRPVVWIGRRERLAVDRLWVARRRRSGAYGSEIRAVAERLRRAAAADRERMPAPGRRIYLVREHVRRRIVNEREVAGVLSAAGYDRVVIDPSDPATQIRIASAATDIVGVHGAALTNVMFMRGGRLLELRHGHDDVFFDCFRPLADVIGVRYANVTCAAVGTQTGYAVNHADLRVDLDDLRALL